MKWKDTITPELIEGLREAFSRREPWMVYHQSLYFACRDDLHFFKDRQDAVDFQNRNYSERDSFRFIDLNPLFTSLQHKNLPQQDTQIIQSVLKKLLIMNPKNVEFLEKQIMYAGFGDRHQEQLREKIGNGETAFVVFHKEDFGKDSITARLEFNKSTTSDNYYFNRYNLALKQDGKDEKDIVQQTFYLNFNEKPVTLKEGYNLLSGRAVHRDLNTKEGQKYQAWQQLDFKNTEKNGNYKVNQYHQNYGFDLKAVLKKYPLKELENPKYTENLLKSLERGNRQSVTYVSEGKEVKIFIEAAPSFGSVNIYDANMKRIQAKDLNPKEDVAPAKEQSAKQSTKLNATADGDASSKPAKSKKKQGQAI